MISLRVSAVATMRAVALAALMSLSGGAAAQTPTGDPSMTPSFVACDGPSADPGVVGSGPPPSMGKGMMETHAAPSIAPATRPSDPNSVNAVRIVVALTDAFRIEPCSMTVQAGVPVTFVVSNTGAIAHEFFLGDEAAQAAHAQEMLSMGGTAMHDEPGGVALAAGDTKELTYTFAAPGLYLAGCHVPGHYPAGMKAVIDVIE